MNPCYHILGRFCFIFCQVTWAFFLLLNVSWLGPTVSTSGVNWWNPLLKYADMGFHEWDFYWGFNEIKVVVTHGFWDFMNAFSITNRWFLLHCEQSWKISNYDGCWLVHVLTMAHNNPPTKVGHWLVKLLTVEILVSHSHSQCS